MKSMLLRTISAPPRAAAPFRDPRRRGSTSATFRRATSEGRLSRLATARMPAEGVKWKVFDFGVSGGKGEVVVVEEEEVEFSGGGVGDGSKSGIGRGGDWVSGSAGSGGGSEKGAMGAYYREMIEANPGDALLLRNYGKFLHEVEGDVGKAEEYYGRALLASPGDGEVLSLYGSLIWETQRDEDRAHGYFDQAVKASPEDCFVLGSYAHFLWSAEEGEEEEDGEVMKIKDSTIMAAI